jgi:hypothetical protein
MNFSGDIQVIAPGHLLFGFSLSRSLCGLLCLTLWATDFSFADCGNWNRSRGQGETGVRLLLLSTLASPRRVCKADLLLVAGSRGEVAGIELVQLPHLPQQ